MRATLERSQVRSDLPPDIVRLSRGAVGGAAALEMTPYVLIRIQIRSVRRQILQTEAVGVRGDEGASLPGTVVRAAVHDEHEFASPMMREQFAEESDEDVRVDFHWAGHEQQFSAGSHRGQQTHYGSTGSATDLGRVAAQGPSAARDMIRAHAALVAKVENCPDFSGLGANPWVFCAQPPANRHLVPFQGALDGALGAQPFSSQELPQPAAREHHMKLPAEQDTQARHGPQIRDKVELRRRPLDILLELANLLRSQARLGSGCPSATQCAQPSIVRPPEPFVDDLATEAQPVRNDLGRLTLSDLPHSLESDVRQHIPPQSASVPFDHVFTIAHIRSSVN